MKANVRQANANWERIGREVGEIRAGGYPCTLLQDGHNAYVTVKVDRDTRDGPQLVMIYLQLDAEFPDSRPQMVVTIIAPASPESSEVGEWELEIDSSTRLAWKPDRSRLHEVVMDVERGVHTEHLALADTARHSDQREITPLTAGARPADRFPEASARDSDPAPRRAIWRMTPAMTLAVLLLVAVTSLIYVLFFRDPCATDWQLAHRELLSSDMVTVHQAVQLLENVRQRGQAGERGSCRLATAPTVLRDAYLRAGTVALAAGNAAQAQHDYRSALDLDGGSAEGIKGMKDAIALLLQPLWQEVNSLSSVTPQVQWDKVVSNLLSIREIDPLALNPADGKAVMESLYEAYLRWGDDFYKQDHPDEARDRYDKALELIPSDGRAAEHREWANLNRRMLDAGVEQWPDVLKELQGRAGAISEARDPAGRTIDELLYTAHVRYGKALVARDGAVGKLVQEQAKLALALRADSDDDGKAALELQVVAESLLASGGKLALHVQRIESKDWAAQRSKYNIPKTRLGKSTNLIVVTRDPHIILTITLSDGNGNRRLDLKDDVAYEAVDGGNAILKYTKGNDSRDVALDFSEGSTYLVLVAPRPQS